MRRSILLLAFLSLFTVQLAHAAATVGECKEALGKFKELGNVSELLGQAYGYAVLPTIGKGGVGIGGAAGSGCVFAGSNHTGNVTMGQVSIGWQLGGQAYSQIIFFEDKRAFDEFTSEGFEFGALILPGPAVVADEVGVFLKLRIPMAGQHFPMRVDVDALALGLFQQ